MKIKLLIVILFGFWNLLSGQTNRLDTTFSKDTLEAVVTAYAQQVKEKYALPTIMVINTNKVTSVQPASLTAILNTLPGVRMEERSPGSYRLNLRGSTLRSPFGVRNVKVYWNQLPFTDPGGNTYFNQLTNYSFSSLEIAKSPAGSMYGAGTGGSILMQLVADTMPSLNIESNVGSFGAAQLLLKAQWEDNNAKHMLVASHQQANGYRNHTNFARNQVAYSSNFVQKKRLQLSASFIATDLFYQTPGGLTFAEYQKNPIAARPAVGSLPSASTAKAAIYQQNIQAGLHMAVQYNPFWWQETSIYGAYAHIRNPAIRNYEQRTEPHTGFRTAVFYKKNHWTTIVGAEAQVGFFKTRVYENLLGISGKLQTEDQIRISNGFLFAQTDYAPSLHWQWTTGCSLNQYNVYINRNNSLVGSQKTQFNGVVAPRTALTWRPNNSWQYNFVISKGFSPPTIGEILPSTGIITTNLKAEIGWNFEGGGKWRSQNGKWTSSFSLFQFYLKNALVQRRDSSGADFYTNAGGTSQRGLEWMQTFRTYWRTGILKQISIQSAFAWYAFKYTSFKQLNNDFSNKQLPSVPGTTLSLVAYLLAKNGLQFQCNTVAVSSIYLNDANTASALPYTLVGCRFSKTWNTPNGKHDWQAYFGVDNLLNENFSLGNDINAAGGRYYNAAATRNIFIGCIWQSIRKKQ